MIRFTIFSAVFLSLLSFSAYSLPPVGLVGPEGEVVLVYKSINNQIGIANCQSHTVLRASDNLKTALKKCQPDRVAKVPKKRLIKKFRKFLNLKFKYEEKKVAASEKDYRTRLEKIKLNRIKREDLKKELKKIRDFIHAEGCPDCANLKRKKIIEKQIRELDTLIAKLEKKNVGISKIKDAFLKQRKQIGKTIKTVLDRIFTMDRIFKYRYCANECEQNPVFMFLKSFARKEFKVIVKYSSKKTNPDKSVTFYTPEVSILNVGVFPVYEGIKGICKLLGFGRSLEMGYEWSTDEKKGATFSGSGEFAGIKNGTYAKYLTCAKGKYRTVIKYKRKKDNRDRSTTFYKPTVWYGDREYKIYNGLTGICVLLNHTKPLEIDYTWSEDEKNGMVIKDDGSLEKIKKGTFAKYITCYKGAPKFVIDVKRKLTNKDGSVTYFKPEMHYGDKVYPISDGVKELCQYFGFSENLPYNYKYSEQKVSSFSLDKGFKKPSHEKDTRIEYISCIKANYKTLIKYSNRKKNQDGSYTIIKPEVFYGHKKYPIRDGTTGTCNVLGFDSYIDSSVKWSDDKKTGVKIGEDGSIVSMEQDTYMLHLKCK